MGLWPQCKIAVHGIVGCVYSINRHISAWMTKKSKMLPLKRSQKTVLDCSVIQSLQWDIIWGSFNYHCFSCTTCGWTEYTCPSLSIQQNWELHSFLKDGNNQWQIKEHSYKLFMTVNPNNWSMPRDVEHQKLALFVISRSILKRLLHWDQGETANIEKN